MKAWKTELFGIVSLVVTATRERARVITLRAARDANYCARYTEVRATRAPGWDRVASFQHDKCLIWPGEPIVETTASHRSSDD